ncbi:MAG: GNAT family N-acetyltransferase [Methanothrix sp.]
MTIPLIDTGMVKRHEASACRMAGEAEYSRFDMKFLQAGSLPDLMSLQSVISANLPCPEIFMLHEEKFFQDIFRLERSVIGVTTEDELIAFSIIRIPGLSDDNLGRDISLPEEGLTKVAHLQAAAVHPAYRGNGLQRKLTSAHLRVIEEMGYEHVCCTVSPKNPVSLSNYLSCGLVIEGLRPKKQGWCRYILHKNILHPNLMDIESRDLDESEVSRTEIKIQISDIEGQLDLVKRGFKGFKITFLPDGAVVFFA